METNHEESRDELGELADNCIEKLHKLLNNGNQNGDSVRDTFNDTVCDTAGDTVRNTVSNTVCDTVRNTVYDTVSDTVCNTVGNTVCDTVRDTVYDTVGDTVCNTVGNTVCDTVGDTVRDSGDTNSPTENDESVVVNTKSNYGDDIIIELESEDDVDLYSLLVDFELPELLVQLKRMHCDFFKQHSFNM